MRLQNWVMHNVQSQSISLVKFQNWNLLLFHMIFLIIQESKQKEHSSPELTCSLSNLQRCLFKKQNKTKQHTCHWRKEWFLFSLFIASSAATIISVSYMVKCWIFTLGEEIQTKCQEMLPSQAFPPCQQCSVTTSQQKLSEQGAFTSQRPSTITRLTKQVPTVYTLIRNTHKQM